MGRPLLRQRRQWRRLEPKRRQRLQATLMALCTYISPLPGGLRARQAPPRPSQRCMLSCGPCCCPAVVVCCQQRRHDVPSATGVCCPIAPLCCCWARLGYRAPAGTSAPPKRALRLLDPQSISNPPYASDRRRTRGQVMACRCRGEAVCHEEAEGTSISWCTNRGAKHRCGLAARAAARLAASCLTALFSLRRCKVCGCCVCGVGLICKHRGLNCSQDAISLVHSPYAYHVTGVGRLCACHLLLATACMLHHRQFIDSSCSCIPGALIVGKILLDYRGKYIRWRAMALQAYAGPQRLGNARRALAHPACRGRRPLFPLCSPTRLAC